MVRFPAWGARFGRSGGLAVMLAGLLAGGCASYAGRGDAQLLALQKEVDDRRAELAAYAAPYRVESGQDFQMDWSARPLRETLERFNAMPAGARTLSMVSRASSGRYGELWADCPWPMSGRIGMFLEPARVPGAFEGLVSVDRLEYLQ